MTSVKEWSDFEPKKIKSVTVFNFPPSICHEAMRQDARIFICPCWVLSQLFHSPLPPSTRHFSSSSLSAIKVVSSLYVRLLMFLPAILIPASDSPSLAFRMMHSVYKLNKQGDNIQLYVLLSQLESVRCSMSHANYCFLTCTQVSQEAGKAVWYSHLLKNFPVCCDLHKGFSIVNERDVDNFL